MKDNKKLKDFIHNIKQKNKTSIEDKSFLKEDYFAKSLNRPSNDPLYKQKILTERVC